MRFNIRDLKLPLITLRRQVGRVMLMDQDTQWLYQLLSDVQLEKFYLRVRDGLNITRIEHFAYVKESDLEQIGISKPGESDYLRRVEVDLVSQKWKIGVFASLIFSSHAVQCFLQANPIKNLQATSICFLKKSH